MKVLKLRFKNLNALVGEWEIDFSSPPYVVDGIFLISGPTGAGKTTILDAICLALFAATPRLGKISRGSNELMSRHTGECFAEITIETPNGRYRCSFRQHRARKTAKGELQTPQHEIADADSGAVLETKLKKVLSVVEKVTGMDFDRFTRSMLLAQGGFAAFLNAAPDERSPILEQITGTALYSRISMHLHERWRSEGERLRMLRAAISGDSLLDLETRRELQGEAALLREKTGQLNQEIEALGAALQHHRTMASLVAEVEMLERQSRGIEAQWQQLGETRDRLAEAHRAVQVESRYAVVRTLRREHREDEDVLAIHRGDLPGLEQELSACREARDQASQAMQSARLDAETRRASISRAKVLDASIHEKNQRVQSLKKAEAEAGQSVARLERGLLEHQSRLSSLNAELDAVIDYRETHGIDAGLVRQLSGIESRFHRLQENIARCEELKEELRDARKSEEALTAELSKQRQSQEAQAQALLKGETDLLSLITTRQQRYRGDVETLKEAHRELEVKIVTIEKIKQNVEAVSGLKATLQVKEGEIQSQESNLGKHAESLHQATLALRKSKQEIQRLEDERARQRRVADLLDERKYLEAGKPCPLCGSEHHPYSTGETPIPTAAETELRRAVAHQEALSASMLEMNMEIADCRERIGRLTETHRHLVEQLDDLDAETDGMIAGLRLDESGSLEARLDECLRSTRADCEKSIETITEIESLEARIGKLQLLLESHKHEYQRSTDHVGRLELRIGAVRDGVARLGETLKKSESKQEILVRETLQIVRPFGVVYLDPQEIEVTFEKLQQRCRTWLEQNEIFETKSTEISRIGSEITIAREKHEHQTSSLSALREERAHCERSLAPLQAERSDCLGERDPEHEEDRVARMLLSAEQTKESAARQLSRISEKVSSTIRAVSDLENRQAKRKQALAREERAFRTQLLEAGFETETQFLEALLSEAERLEQEKKIADIAKQRSDLRSRLADREERLEAAAAVVAELSPEETVTDGVAEKKEALLSAQRRLGSLEQRLADDETARKHHEDHMRAVVDQERMFERFEALHNLIGSRDGKRFRNFAQGLTLQTVVRNANRQLAKMSDRYRLIQDMRDPLALNVVDKYQAGEVRSTKNLSGGESFIVSLALALGLSKMASQNVRVDALFLDEGFGTLDDEHLDTAMDTLAFLQQEGKLIGVISHVSSLKERIATQIELVPTVGGRSRVKGPGCRRVT